MYVSALNLNEQQKKMKKLQLRVKSDFLIPYDVVFN